MDEKHITVSWTVECEYDFWEDEIKEVYNYYNLMLEDSDEEITLADAIQDYFSEEHDIHLPQTIAQQIESFIKEYKEI